MKKLDIITQPCGAHALRMSLYLGPKRKRMRICIGLETHDYMEAQRRALLLLRYNKRLVGLSSCSSEASSSSSSSSTSSMTSWMRWSGRSILLMTTITR